MSSRLHTCGCVRSNKRAPFTSGEGKECRPGILFSRDRQVFFDAIIPFLFFEEISFSMDDDTRRRVSRDGMYQV